MGMQFNELIGINGIRVKYCNIRDPNKVLVEDEVFEGIQGEWLLLPENRTEFIMGIAVKY